MTSSVGNGITSCTGCTVGITEQQRKLSDRYERVSNSSAFRVISAAFIGAFAIAHVNGRLRSRIPPNLLATI